ncbi:MAG: hypothetical protein CL910_04585 [Deltaproteobacteria bacterium]|jgi:two-component system alkaline phosphatase synthesis response regulator PhoP|nr:hypothetical protein [Deltaproteobacteria bacterium]
MDPVVHAARPRVLVVEPSPDQQVRIRAALEASYEVALTASVDGALRTARTVPPHIFLVDVGHSDGERLCSQVRRDARLRSIPIVLLSGRDEPRDEAMASSLGAQGQLSGPFDAAELRARLAARLRELPPGGGRRPTPRQWGRLRIDTDARRAWIADGEEGGTALDLTPREFRILHFLAESEGRVVMRSELQDHAWEGVTVAPRAVDLQVCDLRKKLGPLREAICSIRGTGYLFQREWASETDGVS